MKNAAISILGGLALALISCSDKSEGSSTSVILNETGHTVNIIPYLQGNPDATRAREIAPFATETVYEAYSIRGKALGPSYATVIQPFDSVVVVYDDSVAITHHRFSNTTATTGIPFSSKRSISNEDNFIITIIEESKHQIIGKYEYHITEQDYEDALQ